MSTTTNVTQVKLNIMTQEQFDNITPDSTQLYMIADAPNMSLDELMPNYSNGTNVNSGNFTPSKNGVLSCIIDTPLSDTNGVLVTTQSGNVKIIQCTVTTSMGTQTVKAYLNRGETYTITTTGSVTLTFFPLKGEVI